MSNILKLLSELSELEEKATRGKWGYTYDGSSDYSLGREEDPQVDRVCGFHDYHSKDYDKVIGNIKFICASRNALPKLIEAIKVLTSFCEDTIKFGCAECGKENDAKQALERVEEILK